MTTPWTGVSSSDRQAIELATLDLALTDDGYRQLGACSTLGQAAILLAQDESALEAWYEAASAPVGSISRVLSRAVDFDDVSDRIDATLVDDPTVLADLCRAQITWSHSEMKALLDQPSQRICAAWMLSQTSFDPLLDWLEGDRSAEEVVDVARGAASSGVPEIFDALAPWLGAIRDDAPGSSAQLEASLFVLSPEAWGRGFLRGQWDAEFLHDSVGIADILCSAGQSCWSAALAAFDPSSDEFGAIARMVVAGAAANLHFGPDEPPLALVNAFYVEDWPTLAAHPAFAVASILAEDDAWQEPLLESAMHDLLLARGIDSPGIGGLPLSSSHPDAEEIALARGVAAAPDADPIALVATMCDLQELRSLPDYEALPEAFVGLCTHDHPVVRQVADQLRERVELDVDVVLAGAETVAAFAAAERIARRATLEAMEALIELWADGPILRAGLVSALLHQELRAAHFSTEDQDK